MSEDTQMLMFDALDDFSYQNSPSKILFSANNKKSRNSRRSILLPSQGNQSFGEDTDSQDVQNEKEKFEREPEEQDQKQKTMVENKINLEQVESTNTSIESCTFKSQTSDSESTLTGHVSQNSKTIINTHSADSTPKFNFNGFNNFNQQITIPNRGNFSEKTCSNNNFTFKYKKLTLHSIEILENGTTVDCFTGKEDGHNKIKNFSSLAKLEKEINSNSVTKNLKEKIKVLEILNELANSNFKSGSSSTSTVVTTAVKTLENMAGKMSISASLAEKVPQTPTGSVGASYTEDFTTSSTIVGNFNERDIYSDQRREATQTTQPETTQPEMTHLETTQTTCVNLKGLPGSPTLQPTNIQLPSPTLSSSSVSSACSLTGNRQSSKKSRKAQSSFIHEIPDSDLKKLKACQPTEYKAMVYAKYGDGCWYPGKIASKIISHLPTEKLQVFFLDDGSTKSMKKGDILKCYLLPVETRIFYRKSKDEYEYFPCLVKGYCYLEGDSGRPGYQVVCIETGASYQVGRENTCLKNPIPLELKEAFKINLQPLTPTKHGVCLENIANSRSRSGRQSIISTYQSSSSKSAGKQIGAQTKRRRTGDFDFDNRENLNPDLNFGDAGYTVTFGQKNLIGGGTKNSKKGATRSRRSRLFGDQENTLTTLAEESLPR